MGGNESVAAPSGANRDKRPAGAEAGPSQGVFGDRQVSAMPEKERLPSRTDRPAGQRSAGAGPDGLTARSVRRGKARPRPYPTTAAGELLPHKNFRYAWNKRYAAIDAWYGKAVQRSDTYAMWAGAAAKDAVKKLTTDEYRHHALRPKESNASSPVKAYEGLRGMTHPTKQPNEAYPERPAEVRKSVEEIDRVTEESWSELRRRAGEFDAIYNRSGRPRDPATVPDRLSLGAWLLQQAQVAGGTVAAAYINSGGAASDAVLAEEQYFGRLAEEVVQEVDPWTVSRRLVREQGKAGRPELEQRLEAAHGRLVRVMAGVAEAQAAPAAVPDSEPAASGRGRHRWGRHYAAIDAWRGEAVRRSDTYAMWAGAAAKDAVTELTTGAYLRHALQPKESNASSPDKGYGALRRMMFPNKLIKEAHPERPAEVRKSVEEIDRVTEESWSQLRRRAGEFDAIYNRSGRPRDPATVPDPLSLGAWLLQQAQAARGTVAAAYINDGETASDAVFAEEQYFGRLAEEVVQEVDPWTVSRRLVREQGKAGRPELEQRLEAAHGRLVRMMAGVAEAQAAPAPAAVPDSEPAALGRKSYRWHRHYAAIDAWHGKAVRRSDTYAMWAGAAAKDAAKKLTNDEYLRHALRPNESYASSPVEAYEALRSMTHPSKQTKEAYPERPAEVRKSVEKIDRVTEESWSELRRRAGEFDAIYDWSGRPREPATVPDPLSLGAWLQQQAQVAGGTVAAAYNVGGDAALEMAYASSVEAQYFGRLAEEVVQEVDPWTVSRRLVREQGKAGRPELEQRLEAAHGRLVRMMVLFPA